jgi:chromosome segregation ATPase
MKFAALALLVCFLGAGFSPLLHGIDLMAMKKQEDERRKNLAKSKLKVTDTNVNSVAVGGKRFSFVQIETDGVVIEEEAPAAEGAVKKDDVTRQPDFWKKQQTDLEQRIAKLKEDIEREQSELNRLWSDFYIKNIAAEQEAIRAQIAQLTNQIEQKKLFLSQSETQLEDLYEKARKAGVPPGWLR